MRYLIQNKKEFVITCGVFATFFIIVSWTVWSIVHGEFSWQNVLAMIAEAIELLAWYYNMPTSEENNEATAEMRQRKAENDPEYAGEKFYDDIFVSDDDDGDEDGDEDEE